jgi:hypothetical protein
MRNDGGRRGIYAKMRRRLPQMRGILPKNVFDGAFDVI